MEMISMLGLKDVWRQHFTMYVTNPIEIYLDRVCDRYPNLYLCIMDIVG
jgi:hypothetical protein